MMAARAFALELGPDRWLRGDVELPPRASWPAPVIVFCHGFKGFKDWGPWPWLARTLAARGFVGARFNFSHNGVAHSTERHDEPHKFAVNTYGLEREDLAALLARRAEWGLPAGCAGPALGLVGHSRGGMIALWHAATDPAVHAVVTLGTPSHADRFSAAECELWRARGHVEIPNTRTGQVLRLERSVLEDFEARADEYDLHAALAARAVPTLVVHAADDATVPVAEAERLHAGVRDAQKRLVVLPTGGHTFGAVHPFQGPTPELQQVAALCAAWCEEHVPR